MAEHEVSALAPGLVAGCSCGDWSTGEMRAGVDYTPLWEAHLRATASSRAGGES